MRRLMLGAMLVVLMAPGAGAGELLLRGALLVGTRGEAAAAEPTAALLPGDWDPTADAEELTRMLSLGAIREVTRFTARVAEDAGGPSFTGILDGQRYTLHLVHIGAVKKSGEGTAETVQLDAEILRGEEVVAAPHLVARLGQKANLGSQRDDGSFVFFVVQLDR